MTSAGATHQQRRFRGSLITAILSMGALTFLAMSASLAAAQDATEEDDLPRYWETHAFLMTAGTILFVSSYVALWLKYVSKVKGVRVPALAVRISRNWCQLHTYSGVAGVSLLVAGSVWGYIITEWAHHGSHLRIAHSYIGVAAAFISLVPLALGFMTNWGRNHKHQMRWWHVVLGLAAIVIMVLGLSSGWALE